MSLPRCLFAVSVTTLILWACGTPAAPTLLPQTPSPTPHPPTGTPTVSAIPPTATATPAPPPRDFTESFDALAPYWTFAYGGAPHQAEDPTVAAGLLRMDLTGPDQWAYALYAGQVYDQVRVDAVADFGPGASAGVVCRYDPDLGWYEFDIYADRSYSILFGQWLADGIARYTPLVVSESDAISPTVNEIGLVCQDNILTPYVNSTQLRRRQETQHLLTSGQVGLSAASSEAGAATVSFDWVSVGGP
ncbi:MAG TPA: hypothetical protein VFH29_09555 [Anaerolineales bacterium]|nr:hypothetical protein [Anaerolineales bacterium]